MASTNFNTGTVVQAEWCNDVDAVVWDIFNGPTTVAAAGSVWVSDGTYYVQTDASTFFTSLGYQQLQDIADATPTDGAVIIGNGTTFIVESGDTFLTSIGALPGTDVQEWDAGLDDIAGLTPADSTFIVGDGTNWVAETGATARTSIGLGTGDTATFSAVVGTNGVTSNGNAVREVGRETIWLPAHSWIPATTNGPALGQTETASNAVNFKTLDFDQTTSEIAWFPVEMPKNWDEGVIQAKFQWTASTGSGTVTWGIQGVSISNDGAIDTAPGTAQTVTDTLLATGDIHTTSETSDITLAGTPAEGDVTFLKIYRDISDSLSGDAKLIGVHIYINTNAANDD